MSKSAVIVGAGPGGLATAMLLAAAGVRVKVIERLPFVGGRTSTIRSSGFTFDLGPTFFLYPRVLREIFAATGRDLDAEIDFVRLDPHYRLVFGSGGELLATSDLAEMERRVAQLSPVDAGSVARFMQENRRKLELFQPCLESPFCSLKDMIGLPLLKALSALRPWRSLNADLASHFKDERVRLAFTFQSKYLGMSPFQCPSLFSILSYLEYEYGIYHPIGGCGVISEKMAEIARSMGVEIHLDEPVEKILFEGRKAVGVQTSAGEYRADAMVINSDFARAMRSLVPNRLRKRWTDEKIATKRFSCSTFMLYLGIDGEEDLAHHTIYLAKDYQQNLDDIQKRFVLSHDPSFYVQNAAVTDRSLAPPGCSSLYVLVPVPHQHAGINWSVERNRFRELALQQLEKVGVKNIKQRIRFEKIVTPADWDAGYNIHLGATFNLAHNLRQMLYWRPRNRFEDLESVYLVGGGTHPGSGLPVIFSSAKITSQLLLDDLGVQRPAAIQAAPSVVAAPSEDVFVEPTPVKVA